MAHNEIQNKDNAPSKSNVVNSDVVTKNTQIASSSNHHFTINKFYIVSFIVLGFILFFVIFYLPQSVVQPKLESDSKVFMAKEMRKPIDESPWHQAQLAKHRKTSQQILANVLEKQSHLENLHIELWAKNEFKSALEIAQKGDLSYRSQEFDTAISLYTETLQALITIENKIPEMYKKYLAIGNNALDNSNSSIAIDNLKIAMYILPDKIEAQEQYDRALVLDKVLSFAKNGKALMHDQKFEAAKDMFTQALSLDKQSPINKELLSEVNTKIKNRNYSKAMSQGYINLNNKKYDLAVKYFT
jgi:tetratricopeptide (TPR) repeat protein